MVLPYEFYEVTWLFLIVMQTTDLKVLLIEDNPGDAFLIKFYLEEFTAVAYDLSHAERMSQASALLDILIQTALDYHLV